LPPHNQTVRRKLVASRTYDIITVGGGLAGSALAKVMAEHGARVLVLEMETRFRDRVRGESMVSWGVAEARELGIYGTIMAAGGHELPWWDNYQGPTRVEHRHLPTTTTPQVTSITFYHPAMQEALIEAAAGAGAEVCRGARVRVVRLGSLPTVIAEIDGCEVEIQTRLVVGADGRTSIVRNWGGFSVQRDPDRKLIAGVLFDNMPAPDDAVHTWLNPQVNMLAILFPLGQGRVRAYLAYPTKAERRLSGDGDIRRFVEDSLKVGARAEYYTNAIAVGPLATFNAASTWVEHPYENGVVLIGDAAAAGDPSWGQGLSLTVRDVRVLRDELLRQENWDAAGHAYAEEHDRYYRVNHMFELWMTQMFYEAGLEAEERRARALPLWQEDPTRIPDILHSGPDQPLGEVVRRRFFGEQ
jgi:2-polyprenyl-6-methoxyphenol hydroxylase-like FAD-dependent oxidoreductase